MKLRLLILAALACLNTSCFRTWRGPSIRLTAGYQGAEVGLTIFSREDPADKLAAAADKLDALTQDAPISPPSK